MSASPSPHLEGAAASAPSSATPDSTPVTIPTQAGSPSDARRDVEAPAPALRLSTVDIDLGPDLEHNERGRRVLAQLRHLFPAAEDGAADAASFPLRLGYGPVRPGWREIEAWQVIPRRSAPRYLLPPSTRAARATVLSYNALRSNRVAAVRRATAAAIGPLSMLGRSNGLLRMSVPEHVDRASANAGVITQHLLSRVPEAAYTAISLRDFHARAKPTVQLLTADGQIAGFAKVASDVATAERVLIEANLLSRFGAALETPTSPIRLPRVLDLGRIGDFAFSIVAPLPTEVRRVQPEDELTVLRGLKVFAASLGGLHRMPLAQTTLWDEVMTRVEAARGTHALEPELVDALDALVATAHERDSSVELLTGAYHGDWVPWNMAWAGDTLWVWDLEYGSPQGPFGLDAMRCVYQMQHVTGGATFAEAITAMKASAGHLLPVLGVESSVGTTLVRLHVIDTVATALVLLGSGRGMPEGLEGAAQVMRSLATTP